MPNLDAVIYPKSWAKGGSQQTPPVGVPFAIAAVRSVDGANFIQDPSIEDINFPGKVAETRQSNQASLRVEGYEVPGMSAEVRSNSDSLVKEDCL
jgi:hypothetical protein